MPVPSFCFVICMSHTRGQKVIKCTAPGAITQTAMAMQVTPTSLNQTSVTD